MFTENNSDFLMNSSVGIHCVAADGTILYANQHELEVLGYEKDEYIGHKASEFQMDQDVLDDMLKKLCNFEKLKNYPARVQGKNGIKYLLYNSSVYQKEGEFVHTRCYAIDVNKEAYEVFKAFRD